MYNGIPYHLQAWKREKKQHLNIFKFAHDGLMSFVLCYGKNELPVSPPWWKKKLNLWQIFELWYLRAQANGRNLFLWSRLRAYQGLFSDAKSSKSSKPATGLILLNNMKQYETSSSVLFAHLACWMHTLHYTKQLKQNGMELVVSLDFLGVNSWLFWVFFICPFAS